MKHVIGIDVHRKFIIECPGIAHDRAHPGRREGEGEGTVAPASRRLRTGSRGRLRHTAGRMAALRNGLASSPQPSPRRGEGDRPFQPAAEAP